MNHRILNLIVGGIGVGALVSPNILEAQTKAKKDIILIMTDQQTANAMSCVGNLDVRTPGMDALAKDGMLFSRAYVSYPVSGPSRASLITGKMPVEINVPDNEVILAEEHLSQSIGRIMSEADYDCLYAGKWHAPIHVNLPAEGTGFTKICDMDDPILVEKTIPYLELKRDKPLFLVASFLNPHEICEYARFQHLPYGNIKEPYVDELPQLPYNAAIPAYYPEVILLNRDFDARSYPIKTYSDDDWRRYLNAYYRLVERVDAEIVKLINELKRNDLYDNSLIIFVSDHGDGVGAQRGNQKRVLQEEIIRVPFIVKAPNAKHKNERNDEALININLDIYQTIRDYADLGEDNELVGKSVRALLDKKTTTQHDEIYIETLLNGVETRGWAVVGKDYKYVLYRSFRNNEQLFNLKDDAYEIRNLAVDKKYKDQILAFRQRLYKWSLRVDDKVLQVLLKNARE